nr:hypothetical protein CFP56_05819 [Quercus suber]
MAWAVSSFCSLQMSQRPSGTTVLFIRLVVGFERLAAKTGTRISPNTYHQDSKWLHQSSVRPLCLLHQKSHSKEEIKSLNTRVSSLKCVVTRTRTWTLELLLYNLSRLLFSVHRFFLEAARVLEVARIS